VKKRTGRASHELESAGEFLGKMSVLPKKKGDRNMRAKSLDWSLACDEDSVLVAVTFSQGLCSNTGELCETHSEIIEAKLNEILSPEAELLARGSFI
jgi:hypothetical protein